MAALIDGRRLVYVGGASRKFWEWRLYESDGEAQPGLSYRLTFRWGRLGTAGQSIDEFFDDRRLAEWKARKREEDKRAKGYRDDDDGRETRRANLNAEARQIGRAVLGLDKPRREVVRARPAPPIPAAVGVTATRRVRLRD